MELLIRSCMNENFIATRRSVKGEMTKLQTTVNISVNILIKTNRSFSFINLFHYFLSQCHDQAT